MGRGYAGLVVDASTDSSMPPEGDKIRVFLLDDHEIVRRGIKELLEGEPDIVVVGESGLADEAARRVPALRPDVAILDARLPDGSGVDVCRAEGLTNREIAERMYLAEKTVKNYVSSMLAKLRLTSRTQAAIFATKHPHA